MPTDGDQYNSTLHFDGIQHFVRVCHIILKAVLAHIGYEDIHKHLSFIHIYTLYSQSFNHKQVSI